MTDAWRYGIDISAERRLEYNAGDRPDKPWWRAWLERVVAPATESGRDSPGGQAWHCVRVDRRAHRDAAVPVSEATTRDAKTREGRAGEI